MSVASILGVLKIAATKIPWSRVMENLPAVVDMVGRAKARLRVPASAPGTLEERLRSMEEENLRLGKALLQSTETLQQVAKSLEVVAARQKMLAIVTAVSLLTAIWSLCLWL